MPIDNNFSQRQINPWAMGKNILKWAVIRSRLDRVFDPLSVDGTEIRKDARYRGVGIGVRAPSTVRASPASRHRPRGRS